MTRRDLGIIAVAWSLPLTMILLGAGFFGGGVPLHDHSSANNGGQLGAGVVTGTMLATQTVGQGNLANNAVGTAQLIAGSVGQTQLAVASVGTGNLRTATGSVISSVQVSAIANDYSFGFSLTDSSGGGSLASTILADPGTTVARINVAPGVPGTSTMAIRWRYITASDTPIWWIAADVAGNVLAAWTSDDPPTQTFSGPPFNLVTVAGATYKQIKAADIIAMSLPAASYAAGDSWIAAHQYSSRNRDFRALAAHAGDVAPAAWLKAHMIVSGGNPVLAGPLPAASTIVLQ